MGDRDGGFFMGFLLGALTGAVAALLLAPSSGEELRRKIEATGEDLVADAERAYDEARGQYTDLQERGRIVLQDNVKKAQKAVKEAQQKLGEASDDAADAVSG
jgi:gas vesicle protein